MFNLFDKIYIMLLTLILGILVGCTICQVIHRNNFDKRLRELNYCIYDSKQDKMIINPNVKIINNKDEMFLVDAIQYLKTGKMK